MSSHNLLVETGRYHGIIKADRKCLFCNLNTVEDEFHFILQCPVYNAIRKQYIKPYYYKRPSSFKLVQLLSTENVKDICNLCKYLYHATKLRNELL